MKNRKKLSIIYYAFVFILTYALVVYYGMCFGEKIKGESVTTIISSLFILLIIGGLSYFLTIIIHEAGHFFFGLLTGYKFSSFRMLNIMIIKQNNRLKIKKYSLAGTAGQCIMIPPSINENTPYILYNYGGPLFSLLFAIVFFAIYINVPQLSYISSFSYCLAVYGIFIFLTNGIPLELFSSNDAMNIIYIKKDKKYLKYINSQFKTIELVSEGVRLKDISDDILFFPNLDNVDNVTVCGIAENYCEKLIDKHEFNKAEEKINEILNKNTEINSIYKNMLIANLIYCKIIKKESKEEIDSLTTKEYKKFESKMKNHPSILRINYAYSLLVENNRSKANTYIEKFNKISKTHPYQSEITSEKELIHIAKNLA